MKTIGLQPISKNAKVISGFAFKSSEFVDSGIPVIKIANVKKDSVTLDDCQFVDRKYLSLNEKYKINNGDVLIALTGSQLSQPNSVVGRVTRYHYKDMALLNQRVGKFIVHDTNNLNLMFLYYYLVQEKILYSLAINAKGSANQANISPSDIERIQIPTFTLSRQKMIASILSSYDDLININHRRIQLLEESARFLFREWFVYFRFPGHEKMKIVDGIPEGWEKGLLEDIATVKKGRNITFEQAVDGDIPVVGGGLAPTYYHNKANVSAPVITISASGANAGFVNMYDTDIWASDCSYIDKNSTKYIYSLYLKLKNLQTAMFGFQVGAAQPHVYPRDLNRLRLLKAPDGLCIQFEQLITPIFNLIKNLKIQNQKLAQARDLLLPRLMSGAIEV